MAKGRSVTLGSQADKQIEDVNKALSSAGCSEISVSEALRVGLRVLSTMPEQRIKAAVEHNRKQEFMNQ
ncbi:hypothetical protein NTE19_003386 [Vibrio fluvialis]|nr:hypothetical protein [Vibrio fluvialis]